MIALRFDGEEPGFAIDAAPPTVQELLAAAGLRPEMVFVTAGGSVIPESAALDDGDEVTVHPVRALEAGTGSAALHALGVPRSGVPHAGIPRASGWRRGGRVGGRRLPADRVPRCDHCRRRPAMAVRRLRASLPMEFTLHLCRDCWLDDLRGRVFATIDWHRLLAGGGRVVVPLSGEKDSALCLDMLMDYATDRRLAVEVAALSVQASPGQYFRRRLGCARTLAARRGVALTKVSFKDAFGCWLDDVVRGAARQGGAERPCAVCDALTRAAIARGATALGAALVAEGRNATDIEADILQAWYGRRDVDVRPMRDAARGYKVVSILSEVTEKESALYSFVQGLPVHHRHDGDCPFSDLAVVTGLKGALAALEAQNPGSRLFLRHRFEAGFAPPPPDKMAPCRGCGAPTEAGPLCAACALVARYAGDERGA